MLVSWRTCVQSMNSLCLYRLIETTFFIFSPYPATVARDSAIFEVDTRLYSSGLPLVRVVSICSALTFVNELKWEMSPDQLLI